MNTDPSALIVGVVFGSIAFGILLFGWRQKKSLHLIFGAAMLGVIYLIESPWWATLVSLVLLGAWFAAMKIRRD